MRSWLILLSGLLLWAAHFFLLYGIVEFAGDDRAPRLAVLAITALCLACGLLLARSLNRVSGQSRFGSWLIPGARIGLLLGQIGIVWQALPVLAIE